MFIVTPSPAPDVSKLLLYNCKVFPAKSQFFGKITVARNQGLTVIILVNNMMDGGVGNEKYDKKKPDKSAK